MQLRKSLGNISASTNYNILTGHIFCLPFQKFDQNFENEHFKNFKFCVYLNNSISIVLILLYDFTTYFAVFSEICHDKETNVLRDSENARGYNFKTAAWMDLKLRKSLFGHKITPYTSFEENLRGYRVMHLSNCPGMPQLVPIDRNGPLCLAAPSGARAFAGDLPFFADM